MTSAPVFKESLVLVQNSAFSSQLSAWTTGTNTRVATMVGAEDDSISMQHTISLGSNNSYIYQSVDVVGT